MSGWAATGFIFFIKPGYGPAYSSLKVKTYALPADLTAPPPGAGWLETRRLRTVLGDHLLVLTEDGSRLHLRAADHGEWPLPGEADLRRLLEDAMAGAPERYGRITAVDGTAITTDTGVTISLDWSGLSLYQSGRDTRLINRLYDIHYLRWTGVAAIDRYAGTLGLVLVMLAALSGARLALGRGGDAAPR